MLETQRAARWFGIPRRNGPPNTPSAIPSPRVNYGFLSVYAASVATLGISFAGHMLGFIILARALPSADIGHLAIMTSASGLGAAWCEFGVCEMARRRIGRDTTEYQGVLGHSLIMIFGLGSLLSIALTLVVSTFFDLGSSYIESVKVAALIIPANIAPFVFIGFAEQVAVAHGHMRIANSINAGYGLMRALVACLACYVFGVSSLVQWAPWHCAFYTSVFLGCVAAVWRYGAPQWTFLRSEVRRGATMSTWAFLHMLRQNVDLLALGTIASPAFIGNYSVARRSLGVASIVGQALDRILYSKLVLVGKTGAGPTFSLVKKYAKYLTGPLILTSVAVFFAAPIIVLVFGPKYADAVTVTRTLCPIVVAWGFQNLAFDALNAAEHHIARLVVSVIAAGIGCGMILAGTYLAQVNGTLGAVITTEFGMAAALWGALLWLANQEKATNALRPIHAPKTR